MDSPDTILAPSDSKITLLFFNDLSIQQTQNAHRKHCLPARKVLSLLSFCKVSTIFLVQVLILFLFYVYVTSRLYYSICRTPLTPQHQQTSVSRRADRQAGGLSVLHAPCRFSGVIAVLFFITNTYYYSKIIVLNLIWFVLSFFDSVVSTTSLAHGWHSILQT